MHPLATLDAALSALPAGPFAADETSIVDAAGELLCHGATPEAAAALVSLLNAAHAFTGRVRRLEARREAPPEEPLSNFARLTALHAAEVAKQAKWAEENPELAAERARRYAEEEQRRAVEEQRKARADLIQRAKDRGCALHAPLLAAMHPKQTQALTIVYDAVHWYRKHHLGAVVVLAGDPDGGENRVPGVGGASLQGLGALHHRGVTRKHPGQRLVCEP